MLGAQITAPAPILRKNVRRDGRADIAIRGAVKAEAEDSSRSVDETQAARMVQAQLLEMFLITHDRMRGRVTWRLERDNRTSTNQLRS